MTDPIPDIHQVRKDIDRVDKALLALIAERLELAAAVRRAKSGVRVWRPSREDSHVRELADATEHAPSALVSRIWAELMSASLAMQGPMRLHIALDGDTLAVWRLVRDRFGASIPIDSYPTTSTALAAAYADPEGVAVLPAPALMQNWWTALGPDGAMPDMKILAGLPRIGPWDWPRAVAVATAELASSGDDETLMIGPKGKGVGIATQRAEAGDLALYSLPGFHDRAPDGAPDGCSIIGVLPRPLADQKQFQNIETP